MGLGVQTDAGVVRETENRPRSRDAHELRERLGRFYAGLWASNGDAPEAEARLLWLSRGILLAMVLLLTVMVLRHPLATNDGPVHVAFAHRLLVAQQPGHPLQDTVYTSQLRPEPNLAVYLLMVALLRLFSPGFTESLIQVLCIACPVAAGYFAIAMVNPKRTWLALFLVPMVLNQSLFWGLYNHCLSTAAFFLTIGAYVWLRRAPSVGRAAVLWGTLVLTFFCHAGGFIMAVSGIGMMCATSALLTYRRHRSLASALSRQLYALGALLAMLPLLALFLSSGGKSATLYDYKLTWRIKEFGLLHVLAMNYPTRDRFAAGALSLLLLLGFAAVSLRIYRNVQGLSVKQIGQIEQIEQRDLALGMIAAALAAMAIMLAFPDTMGGGWTHFRRFEIFPFFWILLVLAFDSFSKRAILIFVTVSALAGMFLTTSTLVRQQLIRQQMAPLADVNRLVGDHCTVVPVALGYYPVERGLYPAWMEYQPFFQHASQLELTGDRVVLFNYLARLGPYPVHFRPQYEPQEHLFHWAPAQQKTPIKQVDVPGYERESGLPVDYVLLWDNLDKKSRPVRQQVLGEVAQYTLLYTSPDGRVMLYQRPASAHSLCLANPAAQAISNAR